MAAAHHRRERAAKLLGHRTSDLLAQLLETPQRTGECSDVDHGDADSMAPELQIGAGKRTLPKRERKHTHRTEQRLQEHSWEKQAKHVQRSQQHAVALRKARQQQEEQDTAGPEQLERVRILQRQLELKRQERQSKAAKAEQQRVLQEHRKQLELRRQQEQKHKSAKAEQERVGKQQRQQELDATAKAEQAVLAWKRQQEEEEMLAQHHQLTAAAHTLPQQQLEARAADSEDGLDYDALLRETLESLPVRERGERAEWNQQTGWGRKEDTGRRVVLRNLAPYAQQQK